MIFHFASDHAGFELKAHLVDFMKEQGFGVIDHGPHEMVVGDDYPDFISLAAAEVSKKPKDARAIIIGHSGQGEAMVANRFPHVRAGVYYGGSDEVLKLMREHNDANVLSLGAHFLNLEQAERAVNVFIETLFSNDERHVRRIKKIEKYD